MQTLEEMKEEFRSGIFLKAVDEKGKIVGSVRGTLRGDTLLIGKPVSYTHLSEESFSSPSPMFLHLLLKTRWSCFPPT